jgi:hypothetical protein
VSEKCSEKFRLEPDFHVILRIFTFRKSATWDRRLYFPSKGRRVEDFSPLKIRRLQPGLNPRTFVPNASTLTTRPPKQLFSSYTVNMSAQKPTKTFHILYFPNGQRLRCNLILQRNFGSYRNKESILILHPVYYRYQLICLRLYVQCGC